MDDTFGTWLQQHRLRRRLSQVDLAKEAGCSVAMLRKLEANRRRPSKELFQCLCKALAIPAADWPALEQWARARSNPPAPSPATPPAPPTTLFGMPTPLTSYIGRASDVDAVQRLLERPEVRLLTLTGAPGVGKTRLSLAVATHLHGQFTNGSCFIPLSHLLTVDLVLPTIAQHLGVTAGSSTSVTESLITFLHRRDMLLVLDNFEHVLAAAALLPPLLTHAPQVRLLITSREPLRVYGEYQYRVAPLVVTGSATDGPLAPALQLFVERAEAVGVHLDRTPTTVALLERVCRAVDGLPLALELAAAQTQWLTLPDLHRQLEQRLDLLVHALQDRDLRQQSMRTAIAWSYASLTPDLKDVLLHLVAFRGGCTVAGATSVCGDGQTEEGTRRVLQRLVEKHLVEYDRREGQEPRYTLLEIIREYGLEQARIAGLEHAIHAAHARYIIMHMAAHPDTARVPYSRVVAEEYANIQAALTWLAQHDPSQGAYLVTLVQSWWIDTSRLQEAGYWYQLFGALRDQLTPTLVPHILRGLALIQTWSGQSAGAQTLLMESFALARQINDPLLVARVANELGGTYLGQGDDAAAEHWYREALAWYTVVGSPSGMATALNNLGIIAAWHGDWAAAMATFTESDVMQHANGNPGARAVALLNQSVILCRQGHRAAAMEKLLAAQHYAQSHGRTRVLSDILVERAWVCCLDDQVDEAYTYLVESVHHAETCGYVLGLLTGLDMAALIWAARGDAERAIHLCAAGTTLRAHYTLVRGPLDEPRMIALYQTLQAQGDPASYARAWQTGQAFTLSEAITEACPPGSDQPAAPANEPGV